MIVNRVVHIVDSQAAHRRALVQALRAQGMETIAYAHAVDLLEAAAYAAPGCVLLVVPEEARDQIAAIHRLLRTRPEMAVIVMGHQPTLAEAVAALRAGAVDVLEMPCPASKLRLALDYAFHLLPDRLERQKGVAKAAALHARLTPREHEVLMGVVAGLTNRAIGEKLSIGVRTVEMHRSNIMGKLQMDNLAALIRFAVLAGLEDKGAHAA